jgi:hypothetical protein
MATERSIVPTETSMKGDHEKLMRYLLLTFLTVFSASIGTAAVTGTLFGVTDNAIVPSVIYNINPSTGVIIAGHQVTLNGSIFFGITGIAFSKEEGRLYASARVICGPADCHNPLYTINPATGVAKQVGTGGELTEITRLALDPTTATLYGAGYSAFSQQDFRLFTVDPTSGHTKNVWVTNFVGVTTMTFDAHGNLFLIETVPVGNGVDISRLVRVDKTTAAVISTTVLSHSLGFSAGMAFDPVTGIAYVADGNFHGSNNLYTLNTSTGLLTAVGPTGTAFRFGIGGLSSNPGGRDIQEREDPGK